VGEITLTPNIFFFEPDMHDMTSVELGLAATSLHYELKHVTSCDTRSVRTQVEAPADHECAGFPLSKA
jgi:hypothetical protein